MECTIIELLQLDGYDDDDDIAAAFNVYHTGIFCIIYLVFIDTMVVVYHDLFIYMSQIPKFHRHSKYLYGKICKSIIVIQYK